MHALYAGAAHAFPARGQGHGAAQRGNIDSGRRRQAHSHGLPVRVRSLEQHRGDRRSHAAARASGGQARECAVPPRYRARTPRAQIVGRCERCLGTRVAQDRIEAPRNSMTADIQRLIAPRSIALIGAGAWTEAVAAGNLAVGYQGTLWRVHPTRPSTATTTYYRSVADLPGAPDAAFLAVPTHEAPAVA